MIEKTITIGHMIYMAHSLALEAAIRPKELFLGKRAMESLNRQISTNLSSLIPQGALGFTTIEGGQYLGMVVKRQVAEGVAVR